MRIAFVLLLLVVPVGAWDQWQGDAGRQGTLAVAPGPWDAATIGLATGTPPPTGTWLLPDGDPTALLRTPEGCLLSTPVSEKPIPGCRHASLQASDPWLYCTWGDGALVHPDWRLEATQIMTVAPDVIAGCDGVAVTPGVIYVPFVATRDGREGRTHALVAVDHDGDVLWNATVPLTAASAFRPWSVTVTATGLVMLGTASCGPLPTCLGTDQTRVAAAALFDLAGEYQGLLTAREPRHDGHHWATAQGGRAFFRLGADLVSVDPLRPGQASQVRIDARTTAMDAPWHGQGPVKAGSTVLLPMRDTVLAVDAALDVVWSWRAPAGHAIQGLVATGNDHAWAIAWQLTGDTEAGSLWADNALIVRLRLTDGAPVQVLPLSLHGRMISEPALPSTGAGLLRAQGAAIAPDEGLVLLDASGRWWRLDATESRGNARTDHYYPKTGQPVTITAEDAWIAWGDGTIDHGTNRHSFATSGTHEVVVSKDGQAQVLRIHVDGDPAVDADRPGPAITTSDAYATGPFHLNVTLPSNTLSLHIDWGDGQRARVTPEATWSGSHTYASERRYEGSATYVLQDGSAGTARFIAHPGGTPPKAGILDRMFAPENQDMTWGFIGLALAVAGATSGILLRKNKTRKTAGNLERLEAISGLVQADPLAALAELVGARRELRQRHQAGRLSDGQYQILRTRATEIMRRIVALAVDPHRKALPENWLARLDAALEDGLLAPAEADALRSGLDELPAGARDAMKDFLTAWE